MEKIEKIKSGKSSIYFYESAKYKNAIIKLQFDFKYEQINPLALKALSALLTLANKEYNSIPKMANYLESLYGTTIASEVISNGDCVSLVVYAKYLSEIYTKKGNTEKIINVLKDMIYKPNIENGMFEKTYYKMILDRSYNSHKTALERKEIYALSEYAKMFEGSAFHQLEILDTEAILKLKQEDVMKQYDMLLKAPVTVFVGGDNNKESILKLIETNFNLNNEKIDFKYSYGLDKVPNSKIEKSKKYSQSFLIMLYDHGVFANTSDNYKIVMATTVLNNKLFKQVREKAGLCYMVYAKNLLRNGVFEVLTGIEAKNYSKAIRIINKQFEAIKAGKITKKEFKIAKESVIGTMVSSKDSLAYMINTRLENYAMYDRYISIDEIIEELSKVTIEDVINVIQDTKYLTHYFLKGVGGNA